MYELGGRYKYVKNSFLYSPIINLDLPSLPPNVYDKSKNGVILSPKRIKYTDSLKQQ